MPKKLKELLDAINAKKNEVKNLAESGKLDEAETAKEELTDLQRKFDLLASVLDEPAEPEKVKPVEPMDPVHNFAEAARHGFRNAGTNNEGNGADGGYTVPQDIQTYINKFKEEEFDLSQFVDSEVVTTNKGQRTYQTRAQVTGFEKVGEAAKIGQADGPQFSILTYEIEKYAGYLPVTNELLADSDQNITNVISEWLGKQDVATRNRLIVEILKTFTTAAVSGYKDIKKAINVTLGSKFAGSVGIYTNDDGLNFLDTDDSFTDKNGRSLIAPDLQTPMQMVYAAGAQRIPIHVIPNEVLASDTSTKGTTVIPVFIGDMREAVKLFDRQQLSIMVSNTAAAGSFNAFENDMTLFRGIDRLDVVQKDDQAMVYGQITVKDSTVTG